MPKSLVIVESPAKAKTIARYLGAGYEVEATMGHIRDLPAKGLGVDVGEDFKPTYEVLDSRKKVVAALKKRAAGAERVCLATDLDREGEAIAWHVKQTLRVPESKAFRVTFNEITKSAIEKAFKSLGKISMDKVNAQQARRILDRLVGYEISPILWKKIPRTAGRNLSAGRVQSVAVRLIVEREREIEAFKPEEFWKIIALLAAEGGEFEALLESRRGEKIAVADEAAAKAVLSALEGASFTVASVDTRETKSNPNPPFTTSTLQQAASNALHFPAKKTMRLAQDLYEGVEMGAEGPVALITYMRTDSVRISDEAVASIRSLIVDAYGKEYLPPKARAYASKGKTQEAHEAVRPTYIERLPDGVKEYLSADHYRLYDLIWRRTVASQMAAAVFKVTTANIAAGEFSFVAKGRIVVFPGHTAVANGNGEGDGVLPDLKPGQALALRELRPSQHFTQAPPRYTEAGLIKTLEKEGIGRPSTYATIISTIQERGYVVQRSRQFQPTALGVFVTDKLVRHFPTVLDLKFTRHMEEELDQVESGEMDWVALLREFYGTFEDSLARAKKDMMPYEETDEVCPECGKKLVRRLSKSGLFLACIGYPECKYTRNLSATGAAIDIDLKECPVCGKALAVRSGPKGQFIGCTAYPECKYTAPLEQPAQGQAPPESLPDIGERACPNCGKPLKARSGKRGVFIGCTGYPKCRYTESLPEQGGQAGGAASPGEAGKPAAAPVVTKDCPKCGKPLVVRSGKRGAFLGCSGYPKCRHTESLPEEGGAAEGAAAEPAAEPAIEKKCPNCGKTLVVKSGRRGPFLACPGYPECKHAEPITGVKSTKSAAKAVGRECPECGKELVLRSGRRGTFVGCSGYPKCRHTEDAS